MLQCTPLSGLSGTVDNTSLPSGAETCWTLSCVGRLQITYNPSFVGKFVVENGTTTALRTDAQYNSVTFNAYWDVKLTAAVDACVGGDCSRSVEFSWGCGMDAPEIDAANATSDNSSAPDSGIVTPNLGYSYFNVPLENTISCNGTLEMNYRMFYVGYFWINSGDEEMLHTNAYAPHFGTTRFTADGNVTIFAQGRNCYRGGCGGVQYSWGCNMAAPQLSYLNPAPFNFTPSCPSNTTLEGAGTVDTHATATECWEIPCDGGNVAIRFNEFSTSDYVNVYEMEGDEITGFPFHETGEKNDTATYTFSGSVLMQFRANWRTGNGDLAFDYFCSNTAHSFAPNTPSPPITPITPTPTSAGPCTTLSALSGTVGNTSLPSGEETCWTLSCVGRLQITYNPSFVGKFVVENGTTTALRTDAHYNSVTFNAYWDVKLTAAVDACVGGDCSSSVEFSWGCGMDAPEIVAANATYDNSSAPDSATVTPNLGYIYYDTPLVNTISCNGTLEMNYQLFYVGNFSVNNEDAQVFYTTAYGPHFGTTRFTADGNVSFLAQGRNCYRGGCGGVQYSWGCNMAAPQISMSNPAAFNFTPSCPTTTSLPTSGTLSTQTSSTECWSIACEGGRVGIRFNTFDTTAGTDYVNVYEMEGDEITGFPFHESGEKNDTSYTFAGSVLVQFRSGWYVTGNESLDFDYVCMDGAPTAPPTPSPPITPITPTPSSAGPCTTLSALSGTVDNTSLPSGAETCWTLSCVGRLQITYNPSFVGKFVVENGTTTALRTDAHYNSVTFNAYWDVKLTAAVDACVSGDCSSSVEFSWGCGMDAPEIDAANATYDNNSAPDSGIVTPNLGYSYFNVPLENTISCNGTLEMNYRMFYVGYFWINSGDEEMLHTNAYAPHFGTTRFTADGNVTIFAQGRNCYRGGCGGVQYSWGCNMAAPQLSYLNPAPFNFTPSCPTTTSLPSSGTLSTQTSSTECWSIACEGGRVGIRFNTFDTTAGTDFVNVYEMEGDEITGFPFHESGEKNDTSYTFAGSVLVQFRSGWYVTGNGSLDFDYVCMDGAPTAPPTPSPPITPITPTPSSAGPCTTLSALSGSLDTSLSPGAETCWTLSCVGRLQITYNPSFGGKFMVDNGTTTALRTDAQYNSVTFNAYWDVKLTAVVDACVSGDCSSSVEFSWGCGMDAPEIDAVHTTHDASNSAPDSATVTPYLGYDYFYTPLVNTISCNGTLEMNYQLFYVGNFSVNNEDAQVFYTTAYGPHFGTTRFTADGNVSFLAQGRNCYRGGCGGFQYSWGCNMAAPQISMSNPAAFNFTPSCPTTTSLPDGSGTLSTQTSSTECWSIACHSGRVGIRFNTFDTTAGTDYVNVYEMEGDEITGFPFHESGEKNDTSYTFAGSVLVQFRSGWYVTGNGSLDFDYICMSGTGAPATLAPSTDAPPTPSPPTAAPVTPAPLTPAPPTPAPVTPAPATDSPRSSLVKWCVSDEECTKYGDMGATCDTDKNQCTCGTGFDKPRNKRNGDVSHICVNSATRVSDVVRATLDVDCDDGAGKGRRLASVVKSVVQGTVSETETECGSLNVFVHMDNVPLLDVAALDMVEELTAGMSAANDVVGTVQSAGLASMDALQCRDVTGAEVVVILGGVCVPLNCAAGHVLLGRVCTLLTPTPQTDDDFPVGAIVGICVGGVALLLIVLLGLFVVCKKDNRATPALETEPIAAENKAEGV